MLIIIAVVSLQSTYGQQIELTNINFKQHYDNVPLVITSKKVDKKVELHLGIKEDYFWKQNLQTINYQENYSHNPSYSMYQFSPNDTNPKEAYKLVIVKPSKEQSVYNIIGSSLWAAGQIFQTLDQSN